MLTKINFEFILILPVLILFSSCGGGEGSTDEQQLLEKSISVWKKSGGSNEYLLTDRNCSLYITIYDAAANCHTDIAEYSIGNITNNTYLLVSYGISSSGSVAEATIDTATNTMMFTGDLLCNSVNYTYQLEYQTKNATLFGYV